MSNQVPAPIFRGTGPGLVPRVTSQSGRLLRDNGTFATQALNYLGEVAGASIVGAETVDPGDFYYITTTGGGFTAGNWAISNGTAWTEVTSIGGNVPVASQAEVNAGTEAAKYVAPATLHGYVNPLLAAKTPADYIQMDGATANRAAGIYGPFDATINRRGWIAGIPVFTLAGFVDVTTSGVIWQAVSSTTGNPAIGANTLYFNFSGAALEIVNTGTGSVLNRRGRTHPTFTTIYQGRRVFLEIVVLRGTSNPVIKADGEDISSSFVDNNLGTAPEWLTALNPVWHILGFNWPAAQAPTVIPILGTLTTAEAETWRTTGQLPAWVVSGGSAKPIYTSDFSAGVDSWNPATNLTVASVDEDEDGAGTPPSDNWLRLLTAATRTVASNRTAVLRARESYSITGEVFVPVGSPITHVRIGSNSAAAAAAVVVPATPGAVVTVTGQFLADTNLDLGISSCDAAGVATSHPSGSALYVRSLVYRPAGALTIPIVQPCLVVGDGTLIGDNCGRILGGIPVTPRDRYRIVARTHTTSAENVQLLGGNIFLDANRSRIDSIASVQNSGGNLDLEIGSASGSANIAASTSIINGSVPTEVAPALRYVPTQALWARRVAGAGTAPFTITVEGHRVAANP